MTEDEKIELIAKLVLWMANCPIKLEKETVNGIISQIDLQVLRGKFKESLEKLK